MREKEEPGMKQAWIKAMVGKLAATGAMLLFLLVPAAAAGSLPVWAALLLGGAGIVILNGACGVLLQGMETPREPMPEPVAPQRVQLRVVRGGRAA